MSHNIENVKSQRDRALEEAEQLRQRAERAEWLLRCMAEEVEQLKSEIGQLKEQRTA